MRHRSKGLLSGYVFPGRTGKPYEPSTILSKVFKPVAVKLGLPPFTWRTFRRSLSTTLQESGVPVRTAQEILGHSSPEMTLAVYTEATEKSQRQAIHKIDRLLFPNVPKSGATLE